MEQPPEEKPRTDADDPGEAVPPGDGAGKGAGRGVPAVLRRPAAGGSGAQQQLPPVEQWDPQAASLTQMEGMQPVTVRWCPNPQWRQSTVWVKPKATADNLKFLLETRAQAHGSALRVVCGVGGQPIVHNTLLWPTGAPPADGPQSVFVLVPSFG